MERKGKEEKENGENRKRRGRFKQMPNLDRLRYPLISHVD
jgi:hypothetical protein